MEAEAVFRARSLRRGAGAMRTALFLAVRPARRPARALRG